MHCPQFWRLENPKSGCQKIQCLVRACSQMPPLAHLHETGRDKNECPFSNVANIASPGGSHPPLKVPRIFLLTVGMELGSTFRAQCMFTVFLSPSSEMKFPSPPSDPCFLTLFAFPALEANSLTQPKPAVSLVSKLKGEVSIVKTRSYIYAYLKACSSHMHTCMKAYSIN